MRFLLIAILFAVPWTSQAEMYGLEYQACNQSTTVDIVSCVDSAARQWDARLNESYQALVGRSEAPQVAALRTAQRLWIKYRDANCEFYAAGEGSISRIHAAECLRAMTKARTCELQKANVWESGTSRECR